jgi:hypothetical protein
MLGEWVLARLEARGWEFNVDFSLSFGFFQVFFLCFLFLFCFGVLVHSMYAFFFFFFLISKVYFKKRRGAQPIVHRMYT